MKLVNRYYLNPKGPKSLRWKSYCKEYENGDRILLSYLVPVLKQTKEGKPLDGTGIATTGRHIKSFAGITGSEFKNLPAEEE